MNLINKVIPKIQEQSNDDSFVVSQFRKQQFNMLPEYLDNCMSYLNKLSNGYVKRKSISRKSILKYQDIYGYRISSYDIEVENPDDRSICKPFAIFNLPDLIHDNFFYINGSYYTPCIYILDKPLIYKKNSIKLYGLINSITLFFKLGDDRAIFLGKNIPLAYFLQWFIDDTDKIKKLYEKFKLSYVEYDFDTLLNYFTDFFTCASDPDVINQLFYDLFFDNLTEKIYQEIYHKKFTFKELINYVIDDYLQENFVHFVDLTEKRLMFLEVLLAPLFKKVRDLAYQLARGNQFSSIAINPNEIIAYFMSDLKHQFFYDNVNFYSSVSSTL